MLTARQRCASVLDSIGDVVGPRLGRDTAVGLAMRRLRHRFPRQTGPLVIPRIIAAFGRAYDDAVFVQVGSNDGQRFDPLHREIALRRWTGVMVEPVPYVFERLARNYRGIDRVRLENVAISDHDGTQTLYYLPPADDDTLPSWYDALASFRRDVVVGHRDAIPDVEDRLATIDVECLTFDSLCRRAGIDRLDLVHIDTEGYDFEVIKLVDLDRLQPRLLLFEHYHLDPASHDECIAHLAAHGYDHVSEGMDTICLRTQPWTSRERGLRREWERARAATGILVVHSENANGAR